MELGLLPFARTKIPKMSTARAVLFGVVVFNVRFLMARLPACCIDLPFTRQIVRLGGIERVLVLLTIACISGFPVAAHLPRLA